MSPPETSRKQFLDTLDSSDDLDISSGIEIGSDGDSKAITAVIAAFDLEGDTVRRDLYESMRGVVLEAERASRLAKECLLKLGVTQIYA